MFKKMTAISLLTCSISVLANQNYSIEITNDNKIIASEGLNIESVEVIEGLDALHYHRGELLAELDALSKANTVRQIAQSEILLEDLVYVDSLIDRRNNQNSRTRVEGSGSYCSNNTFLDYTFNDTFFRYTLNVTASTGAPGPLPPGTPTQTVKAKAQITNGTNVNDDTDTTTGNSLFLSASASVDSGLHSSDDQLPFLAQGTYFISFSYCDAFKIIKVEGTKSYTTTPQNVTVQN